MKGIVNWIFILALLLGSCVQIKKVELFDRSFSSVEPEGIKGFYSLNIFDEALSHEVWFTKAKNCLKIELTREVAFSGNTSIYWEWDKQSGHCPWLGIGFGWDNWNPKDMSQILDDAAIQLMVRSPSGKIKGLPLAAALEDYSGAQAWLGFSANTIQGEINDTGWTKIILPLSEFNWRENDASPSNIKQLIIQFEASGKLFVDDIRVVPFEGGFRKRYKSLSVNHAEIDMDGKALEPIWQSVPEVSFENYRLKIFCDSSFFYFWAEIPDNDPMLNFQENENIWNGDALEFAFSTDPELPRNRIRYRSTDQHIGIRLNENPIVWDWAHQEIISDSRVEIRNSKDTCFLEGKILIQHFGINHFEPDRIYGFEIAIDDGNQDGKRTGQFRWNSSGSDGFHLNPSLWGEIIFLSSKPE